MTDNALVAHLSGEDDQTRVHIPTSALEGPTRPSFWKWMAQHEPFVLPPRQVLAFPTDLYDRPCQPHSPVSSRIIMQFSGSTPIRLGNDSASVRQARAERSEQTRDR